MSEGEGIKWIVVGVIAWWMLTKIGFGKGDFLSSISGGFARPRPRPQSRNIEGTVAWG